MSNRHLSVENSSDNQLYHWSWHSRCFTGHIWSHSQTARVAFTSLAVTTSRSHDTVSRLIEGHLRHHSAHCGVPISVPLSTDFRYCLSGCGRIVPDVVGDPPVGQ